MTTRRRHLPPARITWYGCCLFAILLLSACRETAHPAPDARTESPVPAERALFVEAAGRTGLHFEHFNGATGRFFMPEIMGAGVAVFDYDNDGDLDVFFPQGAMLDPALPEPSAKFPPPAGQPKGHRLFRNELIPSGALRFTDVSKQAGVDRVAYGMGVTVGDIDNDGFLDLYVTNFGPNTLFRNQGNGTFADITAAANADDPRWSTSATFADYDRDGDLDLLVLNYLDFTVKRHKDCQAPTGEPDYCTPKAYEPVNARLLNNDGRGRFSDLTAKAGLDGARGPGLGVTATDANLDGWVDFYVANDGMANLLWLNRKDGTFVEAGLESGAAYADDGVARAGMGVAAGDMDRDGDDDFFVANLAMEGATLYRNDGQRGFLDVTKTVALAEITYRFTGFGTDWFDFDNDGDLDLFLANGAVTREESQRGQPYPFRQKNLLIRNEWHGQRFVNVSGEGGAALDLDEVSRGAAFGDIDNDGDLDIVVSNNNGPARLLLNRAVELDALPAAILRLRGTRDNRFGLGARVRVESKGKLLLARTIHADSSYCSASDAALLLPGIFFESGDATLTVQWPSGARERWNLTRDTLAKPLQQGSGSPVAQAP